MVSDITALIVVMDHLAVSIRFEVRGGFRHGSPRRTETRRLVSIRFEVRGGFRPFTILLIVGRVWGFNPL